MDFTEETVVILHYGGWAQWSRKCRIILRGFGWWRYIEGDRQKAPTDAYELEEWELLNDRIVGCLSLVVNDYLLQQIEGLTAAKEAWDLLKEKTHQPSILEKLTAMRTAMSTKISSSTILAATSTLRDQVDAIYDDRGLSKEDFYIIVLLNCLADTELDWIRKDLTGLLFTRSGETLTSEAIIERLGVEAEERALRQQIALLRARRKNRRNKTARQISGVASTFITNCTTPLYCLPLD